MVTSMQTYLICCIVATVVLQSLSAKSAMRTGGKDEEIVCLRTEKSLLFRPKPRRYNIEDMGWGNLFHGWVDVQGQGAANDYCRIVGEAPKFLSCELAGSKEVKAYNSATRDFDIGFTDTWYMRDEDGDGRDDYCRCVTKNTVEQVVCTQAGPSGFLGSAAHGNDTDITFSSTGPLECRERKVFPEFGKAPPPF